MDKSIFIRFWKQGAKLHIAPQTRFGAGGAGGGWGQRGLLSYLAQTGMCCCTGFDLQGLVSETGCTIFLFNVLK